MNTGFQNAITNPPYISKITQRKPFNPRLNEFAYPLIAQLIKPLNKFFCLTNFVHDNIAIIVTNNLTLSYEKAMSNNTSPYPKYKS